MIYSSLHYVFLECVRLIILPNLGVELMMDADIAMNETIQYLKDGLDG